MLTENAEGFIFEPADNKINVIRTQDFTVISEIKRKLFSAQTSLTSELLTHSLIIRRL